MRQTNKSLVWCLSSRLSAAVTSSRALACRSFSLVRTTRNKTITGGRDSNTISDDVTHQLLFERRRLSRFARHLTIHHHRSTDRYIKRLDSERERVNETIHRARAMHRCRFDLRLGVGFALFGRLQRIARLLFRLICRRNDEWAFSAQISKHAFE